MQHQRIVHVVGTGTIGEPLKNKGAALAVDAQEIDRFSAMGMKP
jgi:hypothetical protein